MSAIVERLSNVRVARRLPAIPIAALSAMVLTLIIGVTTIGAIGINSDLKQKIDNDDELLHTMSNPTGYLLGVEHAAMELVISTTRGETAGVQESVEEVRASIEEFRSTHEFWDGYVENPDIEALRNDVELTGEAYLEVLESQLIPAALAGDSAALQEIESSLHPLFEAHDQAIVTFQSDVEADIDRLRSDAGDLAASRQRVMVAIVVITLIVVGAGSLLVTRSILAPLRELQNGLNAVAADPNADIELDTARRDEFGDVSTAFASFADKVRALSDEASANAARAQEQAEQTAMVAASVSSNVQQAATATSELSAAASEIARSAGEASTTANDAVTAAQQANELMTRLNESSAQISSVVESIRGIAAQTTMLALNATIEAARAGEAGRGFAVVASEVKDLATETGMATSDIVSRVDTIQHDSAAALEALTQVAAVITQINESQSVIAAAVEEQAATTSEIDRNLGEAAGTMAELTGEEVGARSSYQYDTQSQDVSGQSWSSPGPAQELDFDRLDEVAGQYTH